MVSFSSAFASVHRTRSCTKLSLSLACLPFAEADSGALAWVSRFPTVLGRGCDMWVRLTRAELGGEVMCIDVSHVRNTNPP